MVNESHKMIIQAVQELYDTELGDEWTSEEDRSCTLILIGNFILTLLLQPGPCEVH